VRLTLLPNEHAVAGEPLNLSERLIAFSFEDSEKKADKLTLQLNNFDLSLFDREELAGGAMFEVSWGYPGQMAPPRRVVIQKLKGFTKLTLEGRAISALMDHETKSRAWEGKSRAQVTQEIAEERGYEGASLDVEETDEVFDVINQSSETDARFLRRLAAQEGFEFYVDDDGLHFHRRRQSTAPTRVFTWYAGSERGEILSINVESDLSRRAGRVTVRGRDPLTRSTVEHSTNNTNAERSTLADVLEVVDPDTGETSLQARNATSTLHASPAATQAQAKQEAAARFRKAERATVKLSMRVVGNPNLRAKSIVEVRGISSLLSGKYHITSIKHVISSSGYICDLKLTRDGSGRRARQLAQEQEGQHNHSSPNTGGAMSEVEVIDPDTGSAHIEYRSGDQAIGADDPEAHVGGRR